MMISTINTIEVSALCNNQCPYCPAPVQAAYRPVGLMSMETFEKSLEWVRHFVSQGTQKELNLHGVGEPTLNKNLLEMIGLARMVTPGIINFNTNGNLMTYELAKACADAGVSSINVTAHKPESTMRAIKAIRAAGIPVYSNSDFATAPNNWGGQIQWTDSVDYKLYCNWLAKGQVMITWNGKVTRCCLDAFGEGVYGTINEPVCDFEVSEFSLCKRCHHVRP